MKVTMRQCLHFSNAMSSLVARGNFAFRCALGSAILEAKTKAEQFGERQKPAKGIQEYEKQVELIRENCTVEKDGKKEVDIDLFMPQLKKAQSIHAKAIEAAEKLREEANFALDQPVDFLARPIPIALLEEADMEEKFEPALLSKILPFCEQ